MIKEHIVYNLEFPEYINEMNLGGYVFKRLPEYPKVYSKMMWLVNSSGSEFATKEHTGSHQATASVFETGTPSSLPWREDNATKLQDVCLILSIFTQRHVFLLEKETFENNPTLVSDHRSFHYGGILKCSIPYEAEYFNKDNFKKITKKKIINYEDIVEQRDVGFQKGINKIIKLISNKQWQKKI